MKSSTKNILLTNVELEILSYIKQGFSSSYIAQVRNCSVRTIEKHRSNIITKLELPSSQNALLFWAFNNLNTTDT
ncbi:LuxR C-terminal-related transcriptional regulator [uncultured Polaribacter sp.]|uniref:response regulator transcription factor n=1 Tax=uncultured Polaribacter sp. TaxID=174711 RepID=UPI00262C7B28|nr:LuxR C-terminal-related transcriptional regulator [uncultured Polaribacter sp.]